MVLTNHHYQRFLEVWSENTVTLLSYTLRMILLLYQLWHKVVVKVDMTVHMAVLIPLDMAVGKAS
jgi:hypothetical protein